MSTSRTRASQSLFELLQRTGGAADQLLDAVLGAISDPVTIRVRDDRLLYANPAALAHLGLSSIEELRARRPTEIMAGYRVFTADGAEVSVDELPSVRI